MGSITLNLASAGIGPLVNIGVSASTGDYYQTGSLSSGGGTLIIRIPITLQDAVGVPSSRITGITFNYSIAQERYGVFSSAGTVATGYYDGGAFRQVKEHANGIGKGTSNYNSYSDDIGSPQSGNETIQVAMKITNVINAQSCYYRIKNVSLTVYYEDPYTITWKNVDGNGKTVTSQVYKNVKPVCPVTPYKEADAQYTYTFLKWDPTVDFVTGDATYTAVFSETVRKYTITAIVNNEAWGYVTGGGSYSYGQKITLVAWANKGYTFKCWQDNPTWVNSLRTITVTGDATYVAIFEKLPPQITVTQLLYSNKQISAENKVPVGEYFRIVVGVESYD